MLMGSFNYHVIVAGAIAFSLLFTQQAYSLECAVCLPSNEETTIAKEIRSLFPDEQPALIGCHQVNGTEENTIVKLCPPDSTSCHIQKTKEWTAKSCSKIPVDDCKTANRVKYCYCTANRCNLQSYTKSTTPLINAESSTTPKTPSTSRPNEMSTVKPNHPRNSASLFYGPKYWLIATSFYINWR